MKKFDVELARLRAEQRANEAKAHEAVERALAELPLRVAEVMKTSDRKYLLRWAAGRYCLAKVQGLLGHESVCRIISRIWFSAWTRRIAKHARSVAVQSKTLSAG